MAETLQDLWPDDIKVDVLTPIAILRMQEEGLSRRTQGLLRAEVKTVEAGTRVRHTLDLYAPSLNYRETLLTAGHNAGEIYPVRVEAEAFLPIARTIGELASSGGAIPLHMNLNAIRNASSDVEFTRLVREILQSPRVRSRIHSLLARINETKSQRSQAGTGPQSSPAEE